MKKFFKFIGWMALLGFGLYLAILIENKEKSRPEDVCKDQGGMLIVVGEEKVEAILKSPQSAEFPPILEKMAQVDCKEDSSGAILTWTSYVDARNPLGVEMRTHFEISAIYFKDSEHLEVGNPKILNQ